MDKPTLYIPQKDSPSTYLTSAVSIGDSTVTVADSSIFQMDPNNLIKRLTFGFNTATTETVMVDKYLTGNQILLLSPLTRNWGINTKVARVFTSDDLSEVHQYLEYLDREVIAAKEQVADLNTDVAVLTGDYDTEVAPILNLLSIVHQKRHIFRGAFLGNVVSEAQNIAIQTGNFENLYIGDYWTIGDNTYRIADFNYWTKGINPSNPNHLVLIPDHPISYQPMETYLNPAEEAPKYYNTALRAYIISNIQPELSTLFGLKLAQYTENLPSEANGSYNNVTSKVEIMSEAQVYGQGIMRKYNEPTYSFKQFSLFKLAPEYTHMPEASYWLRDQSGGLAYCCVDNNGMATYQVGISNAAIRPCFPIFGSTQIIG